MTRRACATGTAALVLLCPAATYGQPVAQAVERIESSRPEAWAMRYFTSATLPGGFTVPIRREPGSIRIGADLVWIPFLTADQQRVGFNGTKPEDLNKAPLFARPRLSIALPGALTTTVAAVPPIETFGVEPRLVAVVLERPIHESVAWAIGWRAYGQVGTATAAFTCPEEAVAVAPGAPENLSGCLEPSADVATLRYVGLEIGAGGSPAGWAVTPHVAVAVNYLANRFEVSARRVDVFNGARQEFIDRTSQTSRATTFSVTGGVGFQLGDRVEAAIDLFYTPLWVRRQFGEPRQNDSLFNAKALLTYRLR
jgi:hypothetical protein